jgi:hypothetical protein
MEIVVVHRPAYDDWSFPRELNDGVELQAALRERPEEEISVRGALGRDLGTSPTSMEEPPKIVRYWEMTVTDGTELRAAKGGRRPMGHAGRRRGLLTYDHAIDRCSIRIRGTTDRHVDLRDPATQKRETAIRWSAPDDLRPLTKGSPAGQRIAERFGDEAVRAGDVQSVRAMRADRHAAG